MSRIVSADAIPRHGRPVPSTILHIYHLQV